MMLILRRTFHEQVTFSLLRAAHANWHEAWNRRGIWQSCSEGASGRDWNHRAEWNRSLKKETGAVDEIYLLINNHEVHVATVMGSAEDAEFNIFGDIRPIDVAEIMIAADEAGYWERPREIQVSSSRSSLARGLDPWPRASSARSKN